jgi:rubrerythrin
MTQITTLTARLLKAERERDDLVITNLRLRDKLLDLARNCGYCGGIGTVYQKAAPPSPCPLCTHIRKVLD